MPKEPTYQLTLSSSQASLIAQALDFWMRVNGGQTWALREVGWRKPKPGWVIDEDAVEEAAEAFRRAAFPDMATTESRFDFPGARESFNLRKVIEHTVSWHERPLKPGEMGSVSYNGPLATWWETAFEATMKPLPPQISKAAREARKPLPPEALVDALQDPIPTEPSKGRAAKTVRNTRKSRLKQSILTTVEGMHAAGTVDDATLADFKRLLE